MTNNDDNDENDYDDDDELTSMFFLSSALWALSVELYRLKINFLLCQNVIVTIYAKPKAR